MREIKFNAVDEESGEYVRYDDWIEDNREPNDYGHEPLSRFLEFYYGFTLLQFTGLLDKNGVEIYEGDIVKWGHANTWSSESFYRIAKVELFPSLQFRILWYFDTSNNCKKETDNHVFEFGRFAYQETEKHLEVIGNIHQNPELLEG